MSEKNIAVLNATCTFQGKNAPKYEKNLFAGLGKIITEFRTKIINDIPEKNTAQLWDELYNHDHHPDILIGSGSNIHNGIEQADGTLVLNEKDKTVTNLVDLFNFLIIQAVKGEPDIKKLGGKLNCFSAQNFAIALSIINSLLKQTTSSDRKKIYDLSDLIAYFPRQQIIADNPSYRFPLVEIAKTNSQTSYDKETNAEIPSIIGTISIPVKDNHPLLHSQINMLFSHSQGILANVMNNLKEIQPYLNIIAQNRIVPTLNQEKISAQPIVDIFEITKLFHQIIAFQGHADYHDHEILIKILENTNQHLADKLRTEQKKHTQKNIKIHSNLIMKQLLTNWLQHSKTR